MEVGSRPSSLPHPSGLLHHAHREHSHHSYPHQVLPQTGARRQTSSSVSPRPSPTTLNSKQSITQTLSNGPLPSTSPVLPGRDGPSRAHSLSHECVINPPGKHIVPSHEAQLRSPNLPISHGHAYPRTPVEVSLDAIERLQTQISQNNGALAAHTRDIRQGEESLRQLDSGLRRDFAAHVHRQSLDIQRIDDAVARLQIELNSIHQAIDGLRHELALSRTNNQQDLVLPKPLIKSGQDTALELMAQQIATVSHKANEVDTLKITIEILKNKLKRFEDMSCSESTSQPSIHTMHTDQAIAEDPAPSQLLHHNAPMTISSQTKSNQATPQPRVLESDGPPASVTTPEGLVRSETHHQHDQSNGSPVVNMGVKRTLSDSAGSLYGNPDGVPGSPKRQKAESTNTQPMLQSLQTPRPLHGTEQAHTGNPHSIIQAPLSTSGPKHAASEAILASHPKYSTPIPLSTQAGPTDDLWEVSPQRIVQYRPRGRPRGSGSGSRGSRVRKSIPSQTHQVGVSGGERDDWHDGSEFCSSPDGYYNHAFRTSRGIARRGNGGGGRGGLAQSDRTGNLGPANVPIDVLPDPYLHTKRTRSKPTRNADGILIRKDGRPDMRSQSSAANLRKVHARKEEDQTSHSPSSATPTSIQCTTSLDVPNTPSPDESDHTGEVTSNVQRKHIAIMGKIFPKGLDTSQKQRNYAHRIFEEDQDHSMLRSN